MPTLPKIFRPVTRNTLVFSFSLIIIVAFSWSELNSTDRITYTRNHETLNRPQVHIPPLAQCWILEQDTFNIAVAQWKSAWLETKGPLVRASPASLRCGPWARLIYPSSWVMVQPRKTRPCLTERLLMGSKESNKQNKTFNIITQHWYNLGKHQPWHNWKIVDQNIKHPINHKNQCLSRVVYVLKFF